MYIPQSAGDDDALDLADLHAESHDAATDGICLSGWLLHDDHSARLRHVGPVAVFGYVGRRLAGRVAFGGPEHRGHGRDGYRLGLATGRGGSVGVQIGDKACAWHSKLEQSIRDVTGRASLQLGNGSSRQRSHGW